MNLFFIIFMQTSIFIYLFSSSAEAPKPAHVADEGAGWQRGGS